MGLEELNSIEREILEIAVKIGGSKRPIELEPLYKETISQLDYPENIIVKTINKLFREKYIIEGYELTKLNLLENKKRKSIYDYVEQNPGAHIREIQKTFDLGTYDTLRNLNYLEVFGFLRSKRFMNKVTYFLVGTDETRDEKILILKNARTKIVFNQIDTLEKARLSELVKSLNLSHGQIQPHIKKLSEYHLIKSVIENNVVYYCPEISYKNYEKSIISYIIVIHKENGLALYQEQLGSVELNADLISGFITAIQSFGTEISKKDTSLKGLKYENYNIEIATGTYIRAVILLNGKATIELNSSLLNFVNEFERHFENELKTFLGNISVFKSTKNIFHQVFDLP